MGSGELRCWLFTGLRLEGIYRKGGARARSLKLLAEFRRDARSVKLRPGEHFVEDVTDTLKRFFRELDDPVTSARLLPRWREAAGRYSYEPHGQLKPDQQFHAPPESLRLPCGIRQLPPQHSWHSWPITQGLSQGKVGRGRHTSILGLFL